MSFPSPEDVLPHRAPFLYMDRCLECSEAEILAEQTFAPDEPFFKGHFPDFPVVPGVLLIESLAQTLAYLALLQHPDRRVFLAGVDKARFRRPVRPGERILLEVKVERVVMKVVFARAEARVGGERAVSLKLRGYFGELPSA